MAVDGCRAHNILLIFCRVRFGFQRSQMQLLELVKGSLMRKFLQQ